MSHPELTPQDVAPDDARRILDFLNGAESAQAIADRIELPDEPDIGPRLAARILERRTELGAFTSLDQLLTVDLIGPVRFARIVRSLVPSLPPEPAQPPFDRAGFDALVSEVQSLRAAVDALQTAAAPPRVELRAVETQRYLGQPLTLVATVTGPDRLRRDGVPVTLSATWGRLRGSDGFSVQEGTSITLRAAGDGTVRATLLPPTSEGLEASQQAAIETMLSSLDPAAATPRDVADALGALVRAYRFEANDDLRAGIDIYFRDFQQHLVDRVNYQDALAEWATFDSAVVAYVQDLADDGALRTSVQAAAALLVHFRDWLGAWLQVHIAAADSDSRLGGELQLAANLADPDDVLTRIHRRVGEFVSLQQGVVGQLVGQKVAEAKLGGFLETGIDVLPEQSKQALFPAVDVSTATIGTLGVHALGAIEQTRSDLRAQVDTRVASGVAAGIEQSPAISALQAAVAAKVDQAAFDSALVGKVDQAAFDSALAGKVDQAAFDSALVGKVDQAAFDTALAAKVDQTTFNSALAGKVDQTAFDSALAAKVDQTTFDSALAAKVDQAAFDSALAAKVDQTTFNSALAGKVDQTAFTSALAAKVDQAALSSALASKVDIATLHDKLSQATDFVSFRTSLTTVLRLPPPGGIRPILP